VLSLIIGKNGKARQGIAVAAAHFRRQPPDASASGPQFGHFFFGELQNAVGRVGANGVDRPGGALPQPGETVNLLNPKHGSNFNAGQFQAMAGKTPLGQTALRSLLTILPPAAGPPFWAVLLAALHE
jgi:hypothetical protein